MYDPVLQAIETKQLSQAAQLLRQWQQTSPTDPWLGLALGRYWEARGEGQRAQNLYRRLLQQVTNTRLLSLARAGLERTAQPQSQPPQDQARMTSASNGSTQPGVLVLMTVPEAQRSSAAQALAQVMAVDLYTARLRLSSQHWRLYRLGPLGQLQQWCEALNRQGVPCGCVALEQISQIVVWSVMEIESFEPQLKVICQGQNGHRETLIISWAEVHQGLVGQLPIYESVVDLGPWGKLQRRQTTQDYGEVMDWHLGNRGILRFCDRTYHQQGAAPLPNLSAYPAITSSAIGWKALKDYCQEQMAAPLLNDFRGFGLGVLEIMDLMPNFAKTMEFGRDQPSAWDKAFHLYSGLRFLLPPRP